MSVGNPHWKKGGEKKKKPCFPQDLDKHKGAANQQYL